MHVRVPGELCNAFIPVGPGPVHRASSPGCSPLIVHGLLCCLLNIAVGARTWDVLRPPRPPAAYAPSFFSSRIFSATFSASAGCPPWLIRSTADCRMGTQGSTTSPASSSTQHHPTPHSYRAGSHLCIHRQWSSFIQPFHCGADHNLSCRCVYILILSVDSQTGTHVSRPSMARVISLHGLRSSKQVSEQGRGP